MQNIFCRTSTVILILLVALLVTNSCARLATSKSEAYREIAKSPQDDNKYRHLYLDNKMEVLLVSSTEPTAATVLDVRVGSNSNPDDFPGLAHFLEHLLFLGTKKYPEPQSYQQYIGTNGGRYNATTGPMHTSYYFAIDNSKLEQALDRLSQFFIAPLFGRQYVDRELAIIESEYQGYKNVEGRAIHRVNQESYNQKHPASRFAVGNQQILLKHGEDALYQALLKFFKDEYSANRMKLVITSNHSLDELEVMARKYFSPISNNDGSTIRFSEPLLSPESLPMFVQVKPKSEVYLIKYLFPIRQYYDSRFVKSAEFITHMLGHEAKGTLLDYLRNKGWAKGLSAGKAGLSDQYFIAMAIDLTAEGRAHIADIHHAVFAYIDMIRKQGLEKWRYAEVQRMGQVNFDYQEPSESLHLSQSMARAMHYVPASQIFSAFSLYSGWDRKRALNIINALKPDNVRVTLIAPDAVVNRKAKWFDIDYSISSFDSAGLYEPRAIDALQLPEVNSFIPDSMETVINTSPPYQIYNDSLTVWHVMQPARRKASLNFGFRTARHRKSLKARMLTKIYINALQQRLASETYMARLAGLDFQLYDTVNGITLRVTGYSDKMPVLFDSLIAEIGQWHLDKSEFAYHRLDVSRTLTNQLNDSPSRRINDRMFAYLISSKSYRENKIAMLDKLKYSDWQSFVASINSEPKGRVLLAVGEITKNQVQQVADMIEETFSGAVEHIGPTDIRVIDDAPIHLIEQARPGQSTDALLLYLQVPGQGYKQQVAVLMLANYLHSQFFYELRTRRKLGYSAGVFPVNIVNQPGIGFFVESDKVSSTQLAKYFTEFIDLQKPAIAKVSQEEFTQLRNGVIAELQMQNKDIYSESARLWEELNKGITTFNSKELLIDAASRFTLEDFMQVFNDYVANNNRQLWSISQVAKPEHSAAVFGVAVY